MNFFSKIFNKNTDNNSISAVNPDASLDNVDYSKYIEDKIKEFKDKYDLTTIDGIRSIPISEAKKYPDGGKSVVYMPEQILNRQATEYKKENKFDLAIECLKKANELYPHSFYAYQRNNYERLVDFLVLAKRFDEAKHTHHQLDMTIGSRLDELKELQLYAEETGTETKEEYYDRVIKPTMQEEKDKEEYYWLLEKFPQIAPKSFGGYRRMKNSSSDNYKRIIEEIKNKGYDINTISFWKL